MMTDVQPHLSGQFVDLRRHRSALLVSLAVAMQPTQVNLDSLRISGRRTSLAAAAGANAWGAQVRAIM